MNIDPAPGTKGQGSVQEETLFYRGNKGPQIDNNKDAPGASF